MRTVGSAFKRLGNGFAQLDGGAKLVLRSVLTHALISSSGKTPKEICHELGIKDPNLGIGESYEESRERVEKFCRQQLGL